MKNKFVKHEDFYFKCRPEKFALLKEYTEKKGIEVECIINIPENEWNDFDRFLINNKILEDDINEE